MAFVDGKSSIRLPVGELGVPYYARVIEIETVLTVPDNFTVDKYLTAPKRYHKVGQITLYDAGFVVYHSFLEFEFQKHGVYVPNRDAIMPIFMYTDLGGAETKNITPNTYYETGNNPIDILDILTSFVDVELGDVAKEILNLDQESRKVLKTKPYYMGWMKCCDEIEVEGFNNDVTIDFQATGVR